MYLKSPLTYYVGTELRTARAPFLLLLQVEKAIISETCRRDNFYAVVRKVALRQCGHFMMGKVNLSGKWETVSGAYGNDGLPVTVKKLPKDAKPVPDWLYDAWNNGGGHNGAGSEADAMRRWAKMEFPV